MHVSYVSTDRNQTNMQSQKLQSESWSYSQPLETSREKANHATDFITDYLLIIIIPKAWLRRDLPFV